VGESTMKQKSLHPIRDLIEVVIFAVVMAIGLKVFALEAYRIPTGSMQPTLLGTSLLDPHTQMIDGGVHDRVLVDKVSFLIRDPRRWEVVVFRYPLQTYENYVTRLVGMPGEELFIQGGDIWTRRDEGEDFQIQCKPDSLQEELWKKTWPISGDQPERWIGWQPTGAAQPGPDGTMILKGKGEIRLARTIRDDYRDGYPDKIRWRIPEAGPGAGQRHVVGDLRVVFSATPDGSGPLELHLECGAFPLSLTLDPAASEWRLSLPDGSTKRARLGFPAAEAVHGDLAFWDHRVKLSLRGADGEAFLEKDLDLPAEKPLNNGLRFMTPQGGWRVDPPLVYRDLHYLPPPDNGGTPLWKIPEGHYFMLGDNTQNSHDGRGWTARVLTLKQPVDGRTALRGDQFRNGSDPFFDNPRWNAARTIMSFRDESGEIYQFDSKLIDQDNLVPAPFVPRKNIVGRALAVFMPLTPVLRMHLIR